MVNSNKKHFKVLSIQSVVAILAILAMIFISNGVYANADSSFDDLSKEQIVEAMGAGWNLGNQLEASIEDGVQGETLWGNPTITFNTLKAIKDAGFNTVRIPVSWLGKIGSAPNYTIDAAWLNRVQEVVDYAIQNDLFVIIDVHNDGSISVDGSWILTNATNQDEIRTKLSKVWGQIATRFADYDEHLIFEAMNEVGAESSSSTQEIEGAITLINSYNEVFVNTVRQAGGNNNKRWLLIPGWNTNIDYTAGDYGFAIPQDTYLSSEIAAGQKRIMVSVHYYTPWEFAGEEDGVVTTWGNGESGTITWANESFMESQFKSMYDKFVANGYPVVIGEYGCVDKQAFDANNNFSRAYYASTVCKYAQQYDLVPVYWDNGNNGPYGLAMFNRWNNMEVTQPLILTAIMYYYGNPTATTVDIAQSNLDFVLGDDTKALTATLSPSGTEEWIVWESSNEAIAKVNRYGEVTAVGIGQATITASTNGHQDTCVVTVTKPEDCRVKLYMQNSSTWSTTESDSFVSVTGDGTYSISITGTRAEMSNVTLLYLQDLTSYLNASDTSTLLSADIQLNSVTFNGTNCPLSTTSFSYSSANGGLYIGLLNCWGITHITNAVAGQYDGMNFTDVTYQDLNTITITFTLNNVLMDESGTENGGNETVLFQSGTSYSTSDASWLMNAADNAVIKIKYTCSDAAHAYWGVLGWGAVVDGTWVNGPSYSADGAYPTSEQTVTVTAGALKTALGITSNSSVSYLSLSPYNSGSLLYLSITQ